MLDSVNFVTAEVHGLGLMPVMSREVEALS